MGTRRTSFSWWQPELEPVPENECCAQNGSDPWPKALFSSEASGPDSLPGPDTLIPQTRAPTNLLAGGSRAGRETACPISLRVIGLGQRSLCEHGLHSEPHTPPSYCHLCMHCETGLSHTAQGGGGRGARPRAAAPQQGPSFCPVCTEDKPPHPPEPGREAPLASVPSSPALSYAPFMLLSNLSSAVSQ